MKEFLRKKADLLENLELTKGHRIKSEVKAYNPKLKSYVTCPLAMKTIYCIVAIHSRVIIYQTLDTKWFEN